MMRIGLRLVALLLPATAGGAAAQAPDALPFSVGERLSYSVRVARLGTVGRGTMWVEGPVDVRGTAAYLLRFDSKVRAGMVRGEDRTSSWIDPRRLASLRYYKHERNPVFSRHEAVELYPERRRWEAADGRAGESPTDVPLDELSFMYFIRTLAYTPDTVYRFDRHYDPARNPTTVRVVKRETVAAGAGQFQTVLLEMRVKDPRRYKGEGVIRINVTEDGCRLPVRIESSVPVVGKGVLTLESHTHPPEHCTAGGASPARR